VPNGRITDNGAIAAIFQIFLSGRTGKNMKHII
jgi:hypothetical protein